MTLAVFPENELAMECDIWQLGLTEAWAPPWREQIRRSGEPPEGPLALLEERLVRQAHSTDPGDPIWVEDLPQGIYLVGVYMGDAVSWLKLFKQ